MITIRKPQFFSEIGRKDNQEDYLYPATADCSTRVFILCDGMGGHDNGEVASRTAANALGKYLDKYTLNGDSIDESIFLDALDKAYDALDGIDTQSDKKPGTTMTCLCLNEDNYLVAHIGDSRIYHIRPSLYNAETKRGGILYQSSDHSLVNDLLKAGELSEEEARDFPQKNIITRAMQPHLAKRYKADIYTFDDIMSGDYFFLCCDGVLEQLSNEKLCEILASSNLSDSQKINEIKAVCDGLTKDNYTCWLIPIDKVTHDGKSNRGNGNIIHADFVEDDNESQKPKKKLLSKCRHFFRSIKKYLIFILPVIILLIIGGYIYFRM
ncbi:PP2C family serine/threonine-protein phosphatase [uncultured Duncaniella sp.]|uniref:PP2C family protein-serine/threonine phosphatase n=1 Tax=uncultured Duncaniella sp. TaxID=2768039 RepID=UPI00267655EC|nr:protein phosphatase 2C domain-containing protein [uncultured Duncaniella sp.]MCI9172522.1 serine/threonine-protein phosphatase [Muribaculaceae bacterium]